jgi:hypothetical protein
MFFAQDIGIAFAGLCKIDDLRSDGSFDAIVPVSDLQSDANHFEGNFSSGPNQWPLMNGVVGMGASPLTSVRRRLLFKIQPR